MVEMLQMRSQEGESELLTPAQFAARLGVVSKRVICADIRAGRIKSVQIGARKYVPRAELERLSGTAS